MSHSEDKMSVGTEKAKPGRRALAVMAVVVSCIWAWILGVAARREDNTGLTVSEEYLNLGEIWEESDAHWTFTVQNKSDKDIDVKEFLVSCSCITVEPKSVKIPAGQSVDVRLVLDLTSRRDEEVGLNERPFKASILALFFSGETQYKREWAIQGRVKSRITTNPHVLDVGIRRRGEAAATHSVAVIAHVPVKDVMLNYDRRMLKVKTTQLTRGGEPKRFLMELNISDDFSAGPFNLPIDIQVLDANGATRQGTQFHVNGIGIEDIESVPSQLVLGCGTLNALLSREIVLRSYGGSDVKIDSIVIPSREVTVDHINTSTSGCPVYKITQRFTKTGDQLSTIKIICHTTRDPRSVTLEIPVSYRGLPEEPAAPP